MDHKSPTPRAVTGIVCSDEHIKREITQRLQEAAELDTRRITIEVQACLVTLSGSVPDAHTRWAIEQLAENCPGVQEVENHLRVNAFG